MLKIGEFSSLSHTSVKTLRFYDAIGLLRPVHVDRGSRYRYYSAAQLADISLIRRFKRFGFGLRQIQRLVRERANRSALQAVLVDKREELVRRLDDDQRRVSALDDWVHELDDKDDNGHAHPYTIALKQIERHTVATIRQSISAYVDAEDLFAELRHAVKSRRTANVRTANSPASATWHTCGDSNGPIDCEAFVTVAHAISSSRRLHVYERPTGLVASIVHHGSLDLTPGPYAIARRWIAANGYRVTGPKRELYWRGSVGVSRSSDITEIQFPVVADRC